MSGAVKVFGRSIDLHGVRFQEYLGDGDCRAVMSINEGLPYGSDYTVEKLECINHVSKRMFTRLKKERDDHKGKKLSDGKTIWGQLSDPLMKKLQNYYGSAIKENAGDLKATQNAVWAVFYHETSTDEKPQHQFCPTGENTWCKYVKDKDSHKHKTAIAPAVAELIKPCFEELSQDDLLKRCMHGTTSNVNESFNNVVWRIAPKTDFSGVAVLSLSTHLAVLEYNDGAQAVLRVLTDTGIEAGTHATRGAFKKDRVRVTNAEHRAKAEVRRRRIQLKKSRREQQHRAILDEGEPYAPGAF